MRNVERIEKHVISKQNINFNSCNSICFRSKNLYNYCNYILRQSFIHTSKLPSEYDLVKKLRSRNNDVYFDLFGNVNQQCIKLLYKNWKSFFASIKDYGKNKFKYLGRPKLPKYKDKNGRNIAIFTYMDCRIKDGFLHFNKNANLHPIKTLVQEGSLCQVRIVPQTGCYIIEIVYKFQPVNTDLCTDNYLSIDLGIDNFATCYDSHANKAFIINGKIIKSINQFYNKQKAMLMSFIKNKGTSNRIKQLELKRKNKIEDYMHKASKDIIVYCITNNIGTIVVGHNKEWKQNSNIGKCNNQKFVQIPFNNFIQKIQYKCKNVSINCIITEESYTSKVDHSVLEQMTHQENYIGKRIQRGLFKQSSGKALNADLNGAIGILRKVINESDFNQIIDRGFVINPVRVNPLTKDFIKILY